MNRTETCVLLALFGLTFRQIEHQNQALQPKPAQSKEALGRLLFFDPILSGNRTISCASCHKEQFAFADTSAVSLGVFGRKGTRNTPSAMNVSLQASFFWDGRAATLEEQALSPIQNPAEMNLSIDSAVARLSATDFYRTYFQQVFGQRPNQTNLAAVLASVERRLDLFNNKAKCIKCHFGPDFNSAEFRNIGLFDGKALNDLGRVKIGPLRNIALTAPYMHNGMFRTLRQVIDYYNNPDNVVPNPINRDTLLAKPLNLTEQEKQDLENFMRALTDRRFMTRTTPHKYVLKR